MLQQIHSSAVKGATCSPVEYIVSMFQYFTANGEKDEGVEKLKWVNHFVTPILQWIEGRNAR